MSVCVCPLSLTEASFLWRERERERERERLIFIAVWVILPSQTTASVVFFCFFVFCFVLFCLYLKQNTTQGFGFTRRLAREGKEILRDKDQTHIHTHTHTHIYIYIYMETQSNNKKKTAIMLTRKRKKKWNKAVQTERVTSHEEERSCEWPFLQTGKKTRQSRLTRNYVRKRWTRLII